MIAKRRRRTIPPHKAMAAIVGLYSPPPSPMPSHRCGRCGEDKATVKDGLCLSCQVKERAATAALVGGDEEGPF